MDFFGGVASNEYGYNASAGVVRMRQGFVNLDWYRTSAQAGYTVPLISPLSPTSYATVARPGLAGSGNFLTWSPQIKVEQRFDISDTRTIALEGGLIDAQSPGYTSTQLDSPVEASRHRDTKGGFPIVLLVPTSASAVIPQTSFTGPLRRFTPGPRPAIGRSRSRNGSN